MQRNCHSDQRNRLQTKGSQFCARDNHPELVLSRCSTIKLLDCALFVSYSWDQWFPRVVHILDPLHPTRTLHKSFESYLKVVWTNLHLGYHLRSSHTGWIVRLCGIGSALNLWFDGLELLLAVQCSKFSLLLWFFSRKHWFSLGSAFFRSCCECILDLYFGVWCWL